ncbi:MAG TPA: ribonuclease H [Gemmatimonadaceae bacterium]|nr:ribonuclease H [Gemmatimonadaceae bacterium]
MRGASHPLVVVYADESCLGNGRAGDNPGGAAGLIEYRQPGSGELVRRDFWVGEPATTNNRMALRSVIEAFRILSAKGRSLSVRFVTDSNYIVKGMTEWVRGWMARGWMRKGGQIENLPLWKAAVEAVRPFEVEFKWVGGHAGHPQNEYANFLAMRAARTRENSGGAVASGFDEWLAAERAKGRMHGTVDAFPDASEFRPMRPLPASATGRL